jgi:hypothetical protein
MRIEMIILIAVLILIVRRKWLLLFDLTTAGVPSKRGKIE